MTANSSSSKVDEDKSCAPWIPPTADIRDPACKQRRDEVSTRLFCGSRCLKKVQHATIEWNECDAESSWSALRTRRSFRQTVNASGERAFRVFTDDYDSWWPRTHHIGKPPMNNAIIEGKTGGRCYTHRKDSTDCVWGRVLVWEPPHRLVLAWQITHEWEYQPDLAQSSEVEIRFTPTPEGGTRVDFEHRNLERHGAGAASMRRAVDSEGGWGTLLNLCAARVSMP